MSISTVEVSVGGVRSPVLTAGRPDGAEAVVFVHGNPGPADDWRDLLTQLLEGHGHWVMLEEPERVASLVIPFLRRQLPGPATAGGSPASPPPI